MPRAVKQPGCDSRTQCLSDKPAKALAFSTQNTHKSERWLSPPYVPQDMCVGVTTRTLCHPILDDTIWRNIRFHLAVFPSASASATTGFVIIYCAVVSAVPTCRRVFTTGEEQHRSADEGNIASSASDLLFLLSWCCLIFLSSIHSLLTRNTAS